MNDFMQKKQYVVIAGCLLLSFIMGSIHAFSLLVEPIETKFFVSRSFSSFTYSLALTSITAAVYFGSYIYKRFSPSKIVLIVMAFSTFGTLISAFSTSIYCVWIGYGIFFGFANGLGYGYTLQYSAIALPESKALMMGLVTASYGLGSTIAPIFYNKTNLIGGFKNTMTCLSEAFRVLKPGGVMKIMVYSDFTATGLMLWCIYGLARFKFSLSQEKILFRYLESPGTKSYSKEEFKKRKYTESCIN